MQFYYEGRRQLQPPVRLRTDLVARIHPCSDPAPPRHRAWEAPSEPRRPDGPALGAPFEKGAGAPRAHRTWVTDCDGENLRDGSVAEAGAGGMQTFTKAPAFAFLRSLTDRA